MMLYLLRAVAGQPELSSFGELDNGFNIETNISPSFRLSIPICERRVFGRLVNRLDFERDEFRNLGKKELIPAKFPSPVRGCPVRRAS
jgi:hypothetical protein